jgi:hypothetical protein
MPVSSAAATALRRFLADLALSQNGRIILANIAAGRSAGYISDADCRGFLEGCAASYDGAGDRDGQLAYATLKARIGSTHKDLFFRRDLAGGTDGQIALVLQYTHFFPDNPKQWQEEGRLLFDLRYVEDVIRQGARSRVPPDPSDAMQDVMEGFRYHLDPDARIGKDEYVVFVTRADESWTARFAGGTREGRADEVRNLLGLPYRAGTFLIQLRSTVSLAEIARDRRVAAPTYLEAWRCEFFRQVPDVPDETRWGRTVDFGRMIRNDNNVDGAPEAVIDVLPLGRLSQSVDLSPIGAVLKAAPITIDKHWDRLRRGRTCSELIDEVVAPLRNAAS